MKTKLLAIVIVGLTLLPSYGWNGGGSYNSSTSYSGAGGNYSRNVSYQNGGYYGNYSSTQTAVTMQGIAGIIGALTGAGYGAGYPCAGGYPPPVPYCGGYYPNPPVRPYYNACGGYYRGWNGGCQPYGVPY